MLEVAQLSPVRGPFSLKIRVLPASACRKRTAALAWTGHDNFTFCKLLGAFRRDVQDPSQRFPDASCCTAHQGTGSLRSCAFACNSRCPAGVMTHSGFSVACAAESAPLRARNSHRRCIKTPLATHRPLPALCAHKRQVAGISGCSRELYSTVCLITAQYKQICIFRPGYCSRVLTCSETRLACRLCVHVKQPTADLPSLFVDITSCSSTPGLRRAQSLRCPAGWRAAGNQPEA